ncbi:MAG: hypothetical protein Q9207_008137 [Kuettlingeria erythrocarpa]
MYVGDDPLLSEAKVEYLAQALATGKANHEEVLKAGEEASQDLQGLVYALALTVVREAVNVAVEEEDFACSTSQ